MIKKIILILANKILIKLGGKAEVNGVYIVRMSKEFQEWAYNDGYNIYANKGL